MSVIFTRIPHIELPGPKQRTIFDQSHGSVTDECRQPSHQAHKAICRGNDLAFDGQPTGNVLRLVAQSRPNKVVYLV